MGQKCPTCGHVARPRKAAPAELAKMSRSERERLPRELYRAYGTRWGVLEDVEFYMAALAARPPAEKHSRDYAGEYAAAAAIAGELETRKAGPNDRRRLERLQDTTRPPGSNDVLNIVIELARERQRIDRETAAARAKYGLAAAS